MCTCWKSFECLLTSQARTATLTATFTGPMELTAKEEKKVAKFIRNTCGCTRNNGGLLTHQKDEDGVYWLSRDNHDS